MQAVLHLVQSCLHYNMSRLLFTLFVRFDYERVGWHGL